MWEFAADHKIMVLSHTYHGSPYDDPQLFAEIAERHPEVNVLIVHSGALTEGFEGAIHLAQKYPNLYLDISGSFITSHWIERLVNEAGDDKVVYSSDIPFIDIRYSLGRVLYSQLSEYQKTRLLRENIIQITKELRNNDMNTPELHELVEGYKAVYPAAITDILDTDFEFHNQWLGPDIRPLTPEMRVVGPAMTMRWLTIRSSLMIINMRS